MSDENLYAHPDPCVAELETQVIEANQHSLSSSNQAAAAVAQARELTATIAALKAAGDGLAREMKFAIIAHTEADHPAMARDAVAALAAWEVVRGN